MSRNIQIRRGGHVVQMTAPSVTTLTPTIDPQAQKLQAADILIEQLQNELAAANVKTAMLAKTCELAQQATDKAKAELSKVTDEVKKLKAENKKLTAGFAKTMTDIETYKAVIDKLTLQVQEATTKKAAPVTSQELAQELDEPAVSNDTKKKSTKKKK